MVMQVLIMGCLFVICQVFSLPFVSKNDEKKRKKNFFT